MFIKNVIFWDTGVEDNAFIILSSKKIPLITIKLSTVMEKHVSNSRQRQQNLLEN